MIWTEIEARLAGDPSGVFNVGFEASGRWSGDDRPALTVCDEDGSSKTWTYAELDELASRAAQMILSLGLSKGDRLAALLSRQVETWIVAIAAWRIGVVYVPLFGGFGSDALAYRIEESGVVAVIADWKFRSNLATAQPLVNRSLSVVTVGGHESTDAYPSDLDFWDELRSRDAVWPSVETRGTDIATIMFTSGTTGNPKACLMPHNGFLGVMPYALTSIGLDESAVLFSTADPGWSFGLYTTGVTAMSLGIHRVIYSGRFDSSAWHKVMVDHEVTTLASAPSAYRLLAEQFASAGVPPTLTHAVGAGEPLNATVAAEWQNTGAPPIHDGYGLSEVGMLLADLVVPRTSTSPGSLGGVVPGYDVRLVDEDGAEVATGEPGRIAVHRPRYQLTVGYENVPGSWDSRWVGDLFVTDDLAIVGADGCWSFVGRADEMIVASGHNVSPVEIETAIMRTPGVTEVAVVPAEHPSLGTVVRAVVVADGSGRATEDAIQQTVAARIARYAAPRIIDFVDSLPRTEVGKLKRKALR